MNRHHLAMLAAVLATSLVSAAPPEALPAPPPGPTPSPGAPPAADVPASPDGPEVPPDAAAPAPEAVPEDPYTPLDERERRTLLRVAWTILSAHLMERTLTDADLPASEFTERLMRRRGCFVALKKNGQLRGMQGEIEPTRPLLRQVAVFTRKAATRDPRFEPLSDLDLPALTIEISLIGPRRPISGPDGFQPDSDGIYLEKWGRRALFLPGTAAAQGWSAERTLEELCKQATLPAGAWSQSAKLAAFATQVVEGRDPGATPAPPETIREADPRPIRIPGPAPSGDGRTTAARWTIERSR